MRHLMSPLLFVALFSLAPTPGHAETDPTAGSELADGCASCHSFELEGKQKWGPSLAGILGRRIGADDDYRYGPFLRDQRDLGATWTATALADWLDDSKALAKSAGARTKMPAQDLTPEQVADLVSYLATLQDQP